ESRADSEEEQGAASCEQYLERKNLLRQFLSSSLSLHHLQCHQQKIELLKKSYFYLEIEPKYVALRDESQVVHHADIFQLINPCQFQRMKLVGRNQTEIQLSLLTDLLERLERGREELSSYLESGDAVTFLSQWDLIMQRMSKLSEFLEKLISFQTPGKLHVKHRLVFPFEAERRGAALPDIKLALCAKAPPVFDRQESFAHKDGAKLKWFPENQESCLEQYELQIKLLASPTEVGYGRVQSITANRCVVRGLQPGRSYQFIIKRLVTHTLVFQKWHDSITLTTKPE
ncbi:FND11 protein, partial [Chloroceryle aenea]|nr:FND11 protein [Chloroceryle aenea]